MTTNNSALRVYEILKAAIDYGKNNKTKDAGYVALGVALDISDPIANKHLFSRFFVLLEDAYQTVMLLQNVGDNELCANAFLQIQSVFLNYGIFTTEWEVFSNYLEKTGALNQVYLAGVLVSSQVKNLSLNKVQLQKYLQEFEALMIELNDSDLPDDLKNYLLIRLEAICFALKNYSTGGSERLKMVVESNIGSFFINRDKLATVDDKNKPLIKKVLGIILTLGGLLDFTSNTQNYLLPLLTEAIKNILPPG